MRWSDRPVIAVVAPLEMPGEEVGTRSLGELAVSALRMLARAGADTWLIDASSAPRPEAAALTRADGLLLLGGGDVDPAVYGAAERHPEVHGVDRAADDFSVAAVRAVIDAGRPVFGICRGVQVLNVALGGTLVQHLDGTGVHRAEDPDEFCDEVVELDAESWVAEVLGRTSVKVRSGHHQAIDRLGEGLRVVGRAVDGVVECVQHESAWAVGVQWHPEEAQGDPADATALFQAFVSEVTAQPARR